jgi:hypothetical protein
VIELVSLSGLAATKALRVGNMVVSMISLEKWTEDFSQLLRDLILVNLSQDDHLVLA